MLLCFEIILSLLFAFFLAVLASFLNVVIFRTAHDRSFISGRSKCEYCQRPIAWYDNIPVLSYLLLKGRCRHCQKPIALLYFVSEGIAFALGLLFAYLYFQGLWQALSSVQLALYLLIGLVSLFVLLADFKYLMVPDFLIVLLTLLVSYLQWLKGANLMAMGVAVGVAVVFFGLVYYLAAKILKKEAMGLADIKLMVPIAIFLSWPKVLLAIFLAFIIGGIFAMLLLVSGRKKIGQALPFAPFLILAAGLTFFFGASWWQWYFGLILG